jgi:hypothetical protein
VPNCTAWLVGLNAVPVRGGSAVPRVLAEPRSPVAAVRGNTATGFAACSTGCDLAFTR